MEWNLHDDGRVFLTPMPDIEPFTITSSFDNTKYLIQLLFHNSCMKYLGIRSTPSWNQDTQYKSSIKITKRGARKLDTNPFDTYHAKIYLITHLNPELYYPFTCFCITSIQYININK